MQRSLFGELHSPDSTTATRETARKLSGQSGRGPNPLSYLPSISGSGGDPTSLPPNDPKSAGRIGLSAGFDLQLRQGKPWVSQDIHPFHGETSKAGLQPEWNPTLHSRGTISGNTKRNRGINAWPRG